jgi:hypothetical protein
MAHKFTVLIDDKIYDYDKYEDIPMEFDNLIAFFPEIPPGPHTDEQHEEIEGWFDKFAELMKREKK